MPRESRQKQRQRCKEIMQRLRQAYGPVECSLLFREDPFRLMVAAILAAQCTDARVNQVTPALFARFERVEDFADARAEEVEVFVKTCGLYRNKAKNIVLAAKTIRDQFHGELPQTLDGLLSIPGVGRKIANLILGDCFAIPGIVVDTHCKRLSYRLGFTKNTDPTKVERDLMLIVETEDQIDYGHYMVDHGRAVCKAQRPLCDACVLRELCPTGRGERAL